MSESAPPTGARNEAVGRRGLTFRAAPGGRHPWWLLLGVVAALLAVIALLATGFSLIAPPPAPTPALADLTPQSELDRRWGTYLSEREWGTPREAVGANGWGLSWNGAIGTEYRYSDDGIAGVTDADNEFRLGWAFWDRSEAHVTERFNGLSNPAGPSGEMITDDRVFHESSLNHGYQRMTYAYPSEAKWFSIDLESAKYDSAALTMIATVTNTTTETRSLDVIFKAWLAPGGQVEPLPDGLVLHGRQSVVAVVGQKPSDWQITADKAALDENLRAGELVGDSVGHIGALAYRLEIPAGAKSVIRIAVAESPLAEGMPFSDAAAAAAAQASHVLELSAELSSARREETAALFADDVAEHEALYRQALMSLLWSESYYAWDGDSAVDPDYAGRIDAADILVMPDKWEFPWPASWDSAFHAVTASLVDHELAEDQLRFYLTDGWLQPDGHIPCAEWVMSSECPPIFAWAVWRVYVQSHDEEFLRAVYPGLQANYDYWWANLQAGDALFTGGFLGMDNLPRGAFGAPQADATAWMAFYAREMARIASELRDPQTAERYWVDRGRIQEAINTHMWDDETSFYYDLTPSGEFVAHKSYTGLVPLIAGVVPPERLPAILAALRDEDQFMSPAGIRSLSGASPVYRPGLAGRGVNSNWRGPVWVPINYLLIDALDEIDPSLATEIRNRVVNAVEADWTDTGRLHEYFNGDTGAGLGADAQAGWTALVANMISEAWPAQAGAP